jgi:hypothetical protein
VPAHIRKQFEKRKGAGFSYDPYVPERYRMKFMRYQLAEFDEAGADNLCSLRLSQLTMLKWIRRAKSHAEADHMEAEAKRREMLRGK